MANITKAHLEKQIAELNEELNKYRQWLTESEKKYNELINEKELQFNKLPEYIQMKNEIEQQRVIINTKNDIIRSSENIKESLWHDKEVLQEKIEKLQEENMLLKESIKNQTVNNDNIHNARNAGRKPKPEEKIQEQLQQLEKLLNDGKKEREIYLTMGVSRATYYRLKKILKSHKLINDTYNC